MKYLETNYFKFRNKLWDYNGLINITEKILEVEKKEWKKEQQLGLVLTVATILNAKPFGFGRKRMGEFFRLLFEQSIWVNEHPEDAGLVTETVRRLGFKFAYDGNKLTMYDMETNKTGVNLKKNIS